MGVSPKTGPQKFKLFNLSSKYHKIFKVSKHKGKVKFVGAQIEGPPKRGRQNCNFLTTHVRHMKLSE